MEELFAHGTVTPLAETIALIGDIRSEEVREVFARMLAYPPALSITGKGVSAKSAKQLAASLVSAPVDRDRQARPRKKPLTDHQGLCPLGGAGGGPMPPELAQPADARRTGPGGTAPPEHTTAPTPRHWRCTARSRSSEPCRCRTCRRQQHSPLGQRGSLESRGSRPPQGTVAVICAGVLHGDNAAPGRTSVCSWCPAPATRPQ